MHFEEQVTIARSPEAVFAFLTDPANDPRWRPGVVETRQVSDGPMAVGTTLEETYAFMGRRIDARYQVIDHQPERVHRVRAIGGPLEAEAGYLLEPVGGGTRVTITADVELSGMFKFAEPMVARQLKADIATSAANLKRTLEGARPSDSR